MKGKKTSKILAITLVLTLVVPLLIGTMPVGASDNCTHGCGDGSCSFTADVTVPFAVVVCEIVETVVQYATLDEALAEVQDGETIRFLDNIDYIKKLTIPYDITIDLSTYTLSIALGTGGDALDLDNNTLTFKGPGNLNIMGNVVYGNTLKFSEGVIATIDGNIYSRIEAVGSVTEVKVTGDVEYSSGELILIYAYSAKISVGGNARANGTGDLVWGAHACDSGKITIGGSVTVTGGALTKGLYAREVGSTIDVKGNVVVTATGSLPYTDPQVGLFSEYGGKITIDGNFTFSGPGSYIMVGMEIKDTSQNDPSSQKDGYKQYSDNQQDHNDKSFVWLKIPRLTVNAEPGGSVSGTPSGIYDAGTEVSVSATADSGYHFTGWTVSGFTLTDASSPTVSFKMPANDVTLTANFTPNTPPPTTQPNTPPPTAPPNTPANNVTQTGNFAQDTKVPQTGDDTNLLSWVMVMGVSMLGVLLLLVWRKWRKARGTW